MRHEPRRDDRGAKESAGTSEHKDTDWREVFESRTYGRGRSFEELRPAYSYGWKSRERFGIRAWEELEEELEREWSGIGEGLPWEEARAAVWDAWRRAGGVTGIALADRGYGFSHVDDDAYWRENYSSRPYSSRRSYEDYQPAYRYGWESQRRYGDRGWEEAREDLKREWNQEQKDQTGLKWREARNAIKDAWERSASGYSQEAREGESQSAGASVATIGSSGTTSEQSWATGAGYSNAGVGSAGGEMGGPPPSPPPGDLPSQPSTEAVPSPTYALLKCPDVVVAELEFDLRAGISPQPMVEGDEPFKVPVNAEYSLTVHVIADGFRLRDGESWRNELTVTHETPYPTLILHLTALPQDTPLRPRLIRANYSIGGQAIGYADRPVAVVESEEFAEWATPEERPQPSTVRVPAAETAPDLTISISLGDSGGDLLWSLESPHQVDLPDQRLKSNIGNDPERFARQLVDKVNAREGKTGLYTFLRGHGRDITAQVPTRVWKVLREVAAKRSNEPPTVLILSQEPYVPWELAEMPEPLLDASAPPFLAAQVSIGRWVRPSGDRPKLPPPVELNVSTIAVVSGVYDHSDWRRLEKAEEEAKELSEGYKTVAVEANYMKVSTCLKGNPKADILHFAVHGIYDPRGVENGLMLTDQRTLDPYDVKGVDLANSPFVFLNACQVGSGDKVLGNYAGLAEAFLFAGASGVIAPLWSVKDDIAKEIALGFYRGIAAGRLPASIVRSERAKFKDDAMVSATYLAYQFFGHPQLKLAGLGAKEGNNLE